MSAFGIVGLPLVKSVVSLVMVTTVGVVGVAGAQSADPVAKERPVISDVELETPQPLPSKSKAISINEDHDHEDHVHMVIPGCPHCMAKDIAPHPSWLPNLVRSGEENQKRLERVETSSEVFALKQTNQPLRLPATKSAISDPVPLKVKPAQIKRLTGSPIRITS